MKASHNLLRWLIVFTGELISVSLLVAGCSTPNTTVPTPTTVAVLHPSATPTATATRTPVPTKTSTLTPTPVIVLTPVPPTADAGVDGVWVSPNKQWTATLLWLSVKIRPNDKLQTAGYSQQRSLLQVTDATFSQQWLVEDIPAESVMSYEMAWPLAWSRDGHYLYFTHRLGGGDGCFTAAEFFGTDLLKVNLTDGRVSEVVPRVGYWVALSPDESRLAYLSQDKATGKQFLVIRDLATGAERQKPVDELNEYAISHASNLIWSPDSKALVYTFGINFCGLSPETESTSIMAVNANTLAQKTLIREDKRWLQSIQWLDNGKVLLKDQSSTTLSDHELISSNELM